MNRKVIKLYTDKKYLTQEEYEPILYPFWGLSKATQNDSFGGQYENYIKNGKNYFSLTNINDCDFVLWPEKYNPLKLSDMQPLLSLAKKYNKPILIFYNDDSAEKINIPNSYVFRTSLYRKDRSHNEFALPFWSEDFMNKYSDGQLPIRYKPGIPAVSYCGYTKIWKDWIKDLIGKDYGTWRQLRYEAVRILKKNKKIKTNFLIRADFWGGAYDKGKQSVADLEADIKKVRLEYVDNMISGDYSLVVRGRGNFSIRFYEALSLGRIPLFINTDCILPYENFIDWRKIGPWVDISELNNLDGKLLGFNNNISEEGFMELQKKIRKIWEEWLSPDGFFKNFYRHF